MREIRTSGSEGGGTVNPSFLPLSAGSPQITQITPIGKTE